MPHPEHNEHCASYSVYAASLLSIHTFTMGARMDLMSFNVLLFSKQYALCYAQQMPILLQLNTQLEPTHA